MANKLFGSSNPMMREESFKPQYDSSGMIINGENDLMTANGAVNKTILLFAMLLVSASLAYTMPSNFLMYVGAGGVLVSFLAVRFKPHLAPYIAPMYALLHGLSVGTVTAIFAYQYDGLVLQAVGLTFGTLAMMLMIYKSGLIEVTQKFRMGVSMAVGAVMLFYLAGWIGHMVGFELPYLHDNGPMGIGISAVILVIASLNLLLDFDMFDRGEKEGAPAYMEWAAAMGLVFTIVWLYVEFLRLLSKLQRD